MSTHHGIDTDAIRLLHGEILAPRLERIRRVADCVGTAPAVEVREGVWEACAFLAHDLVPHAEWEDGVLYPAVERALGAPRAAAAMTREHEDIRDLADELENLKDDLRGELAEDQACSLRRILYGLYALVKLHFAKEEEIYLTILEEESSVSPAEPIL